MSYVDHAHRHLPGGTDPIPGVATGAGFTYILFYPTEDVEPDAFADPTCKSFTVPSRFAGLGIVEVEAFVQTPSTSGTVELDVHRFWDDLAGSGQSIFVRNITIDQDEYTSLTAALPPIISSPAFNAGDYVVIQVVDEGTGTLGLGVHLTFGAV